MEPKPLPENRAKEADQALSAKALKLAKKMDPEQLCRFLKVLDNLGVEGVSAEELLDVRNEIRRIIVHKISGVTDLADRQKPSKRNKVRGGIAKVLQFPVRPKPMSKAPRAKKVPKDPRSHLRLIK